MSLIGRHKQYDHSKSSTYKVNDTEWEISYGDGGAQLAGDFCSDTVCVSFKWNNGSVALLLHNTLKWSAILGLSFLCGAGGRCGPGNPCYEVQALLVNFALHFQKCQHFGIVSK